MHYSNSFVDTQKAYSIFNILLLRCIWVLLGQLCGVEEDTPRRGMLRAKACTRMAEMGTSWVKKGQREGNVPIPIGAVVTLATTHLDRSHSDDRRLPGVIVDVTIHDDTRFYKVGVVGGVLKDAYQRRDLVHERDIEDVAYGLENVVATWKTAKRISIREAVANISMTGGQGYLKCMCTTACRSQRCACFKAGFKCNSRCHPKNDRCLNHDECERASSASSSEDDNEDHGQPAQDGQPTRKRTNIVKVATAKKARAKKGANENETD